MSDNCSFSGGPDNLLGLRIGSIFIILATSTAGALFPVLARRTSWLNVPKDVYDFAKYFGSGVIIATAFIHLLGAGLEELGSDCLGTESGWTIYVCPAAHAVCIQIMLLMAAFYLALCPGIVWGTAKLEEVVIVYDPHRHDTGSHAAHDPEPNESASHEISAQEKSTVDNAVAQIIETFEGLGVGSRLAYMSLHPKYDWTRIVGALLYGITTPVGIAAGLGVRSTYNVNSTTALIVSGVLDSLSAGILIYTGLVELIAHEFLFSKEMITASNLKLTYNIGCMFAGWALMSLLGRWA
ncbi:hypothetical protein C0995_006360 [Termitomyces sp. Mi166|nr:hypothetical protein C0995_006360 [Termitomyces sp. Mi166\